MKLPNNQPKIYARKILWAFLGLLIAGAGCTFLLVNESALYFLLHPQVLLVHLKNSDRTPANLQLNIINFYTSPTNPLESDRIQKVNQIARDITVRIQSDRTNQTGSGAIIAKTQNTYDRNTYYIVTAKHVVGKQTDYSVVTPDGESYPVNQQAIEKFAGADLAILQFTTENTYSVAILGDYDLQYDAMNWVFLSGWPIVKNINSAQSEFNAGRLFSSEFASLQITDRDLNQGYELVYTNFSKAGISGGPVLDTEGRVIGIHGASRVDRLHKVQLGDSLGVPIQRFLGLINQAGIPRDSLKIETSHPAKSTQAQSIDAGILG
jgi:S1-C subfamily serine protease